jgi:putative ABC transport system permease protein
MFKSYLKTAWRNIIRYRFFSIVNIIGLATGIAFTFLIGGYAWREIQVNRNLKNADNQYIIQSNWKNPDQGLTLTTIGPLAKALKDQYPSLVANYYRWDGITSIISRGDKHFREGLQICDSTLLNMYGLPLLHGDARTAMNNPFSIVITANRAIKYFGRTDVVGETLTIQSFSGSTKDFMITGVLKDVSQNSVTYLNSSNDNEVYIPLNTLGYFGRNLDNWGNQYIVGYIELQKGVHAKDLELPMKRLLQQNTTAFVAENMRPYLVPLKDYYLSSNNGLVKKMIYVLSCTALFILLMAIINFINISISKSSSRMREIGIRKVMGGLKNQLLIQFLTESTMLVLLATGLAMVIYEFARPYMSEIVGSKIPGLTSFPLYFALIPVMITLLTGLLAGIYPAFILASLKSVDSLKGKMNTIKENIFLRKSLVGFQFCIATIVFIGAIVVSQQVSYFFNKDLGYNKDFVISAKVPRDWTAAGVDKMEVIRREFTTLPQVSNATLSYSIPDGNNAGSLQAYREGSDSTRSVALQELDVDQHYASTFQIPMKAGVFYGPAEEKLDPTKIVINETAAKTLGWQNVDDAVGNRLVRQGGGVSTISGVIKDFHFSSMAGKISPMLIQQVALSQIYRMISFKVRPGNIASSIEALQKKWNELLPGNPFDYTFMDDDLKTIYQTELQLKKASYTATVLAFIIVLLGVLGLVALSVQKRTKEIGIRKVLGASVSNITSLFLKEFMLVILAGGIVACPIALYIMHNWLNNYAYRIPLTALPPIIALLILGLITVVLIGIQTVTKALENPIKSLRTE